MVREMADLAAGAPCVNTKRARDIYGVRCCCLCCLPMYHDTYEGSMKCRYRVSLPRASQARRHGRLRTVRWRVHVHVHVHVHMCVCV